MKIRLVLPLLALGVVPTAIAQSPGTFTAAGRMTTERIEHTATLLTTGRVLITGGTANNISGLSSAELYDPSTGKFAASGDMTRTRLVQTATLLPSGKVLIVGGASDVGIIWFGNFALAGAELYDPSTGAFAATGDMTTARQFHTATLLNNGKVLIAGGMTLGGGALASAELYDPSMATFAAIGNMTSPRYLHTATLLSNGKVLMQGSGGGLVPAPELYDPETATFSLATNGPFPRGYADTATLLTNGRVLFTAGDSNFYSIWAQVYDPSTGRFADTGSMNSSRGEAQTATLLPDGKVLVAGSDSQINAAGGNSELYDLGAGTFSPTGDMATGRGSHTATLLPDGTVLMSGGWGSHGSTATAEIYHPAVLIPAPALLSLSSDGKGPGAIQHANTYQVVSAANPAVAGEALVVYGTGLAEGSVIPPRVAIGGRMAEVLWFGDTPGFVGLNQINVRVPNGIGPGPAVSVRLDYLGRATNEVTISVR